MLALTRKKDEAIIIDGNIEIKILDVQGEKIKIGISAPKEVSIYREEVYRQIEESNKQASHMDMKDISRLDDMFIK